MPAPKTITVETSECCRALPSVDGTSRCSFCQRPARFADMDILDYVRGTLPDGSQPRHPDFDGDVDSDAAYDRLINAKFMGCLDWFCPECYTMFDRQHLCECDILAGAEEMGVVA